MNPTRNVLGLQLLLGLTAVLAVGSCSLTAADPGREDPIRELTVAEKAVITSQNAFGFDLLRTIAEAEPDSNCFISPLSVSMALGMALNGAAGDTWQDMGACLGFEDLAEAEINASYRSLIDLLTGLDPQVVIEIANSIWIRESFPVLAPFIETNRAFFDAEVRELDFSLPEAVGIINGWIEEKTHGLITDALDEIDPLVLLYLINTVYFNGTWTLEFDPEDTTEEVFVNHDGSLTSCPMMWQTAEADYYGDERVQVVDLPYGDGNFSMTVILPREDVAVADVVAGFDDAGWEELIAVLSPAEVTIGLPRFSLDYGTELSDALTALGMGVAFGSAADFSRLVEGGGVYIDRVIHKAFIEVDEEGTEAAAVTIVEIRITDSISDPRMIVMDRPFLFAIREHETGTILFLGKLMRFPAGQEAS